MDITSFGIGVCVVVIIYCLIVAVLFLADWFNK